MDFSDKNLWLMFEIGDTKIYATQTLLATWIVMAVLIIAALAVRISIRSFRDVPGGFQNVIESLVDMMENFTISTMGKRSEGFGAYFFGVFAFIIVSNYSGLLGLRPPTTNLATTAALALSTFFIIHIFGVMRKKGDYFRQYLKPVPLFLVMNILGELSKPVSLAFRLFGNMLGGYIIIGLVYQLMPVAVKFIFPGILHAYFDVFAGALQAFIFTVLSMTFIQQTLADDDY